MTINIDGKACKCEKGEYLLEVAKRNGIFIPTFCYKAEICERASCRVCIVEIETGGWRQVVTACVFPVEREMNVYTNSDKIKRQRRLILSLLSARAPESEQIAKALDSEGGSVSERFLRLDGEKCILCGLCTEACESVGSGAIGLAFRGTDKKVSAPYGSLPASCIGCGSCAAVCPTGAIDMATGENTKSIWGKTFPLMKCGRCGKPVGTLEEIEHAARKVGSEPAALCEDCRKKGMADVLAHTFGG